MCIFMQITMDINTGKNQRESFESTMTSDDSFMTVLEGLIAIEEIRDVPQRQWVSMATAVLTEREWPLHPFPLQLLLAAVAVAVN